MKKDKAKILNHREQARELLPVFYGSKDNVLHGFREVVNNAVDEIINNFECGEVIITLFDDNKTIISITIRRILEIMIICFLDSFFIFNFVFFTLPSLNFILKRS